jgi:hypothetical protein
MVEAELGVVEPVTSVEVSVLVLLLQPTAIAKAVSTMIDRNVARLAFMNSLRGSGTGIDAAQNAKSRPRPNRDSMRGTDAVLTTEARTLPAQCPLTADPIVLCAKLRDLPQDALLPESHANV